MYNLKLKKQSKNLSPTLGLQWLFFIVIIALTLVSSNSAAFHIPAQKIDKNVDKINFNQPLRYQITDPKVTIDEIDTDPELHHSWQQTSQLSPNFRLQNQALWMAAAIVNDSKDPSTVIIDFEAPLADDVSMFAIDDSNNRIMYEQTTGTNYEFSRRALPYRTYAIEIELQPQQVTNLYLRVVDSGSLYAQWSLWNKEAFVADKLAKSNIDGLTAGSLFVFMVFNLLAFIILRERQYAFFAGFLLSYLLLISIINGSAFALLWPQSPAINQSSVYMSSGLVLLFISLFSQESNRAPKHSMMSNIQMFSLITSGSVIFLPLFAPTSYHLIWLVITTLIVLTIGSGCAYWYLAKRKQHALIYVLIWTTFLFIGSLLALSRYNIVGTGSLSYNQASLAVVATAIILCFSLVSRIRLERTAKEQAKTQAAETLQQYFDIYQNAVEGLFTLSPKGELVSANPQLVEALGYNTFAQMRNAIRKNGPQVVIGDINYAKQILAEVIKDGIVKSVEVQGLKHDGTHIWGLMTIRISPSDENDQVFIHGAVVDITEKHQAYQKLTYLATHDSLTGVLNRNEFEKTLFKALTKHKQGGPSATMLYIDLDRFKEINDTSGHVAGDALLRQISDELKSVLNDQSTLARLGGDEFAVLLPEITGNEAFMQAYNLVERIKEFRFLWEEKIYTVGISVGMKELSVDDSSLTQIFTNADAACYIAKEKGRNRIHVFSIDETEIQNQQSQNHWIKVINDALENDFFVLYQQNIHNLHNDDKNNNNASHHYEILVRMRDAQHNIIQPESFIPAAERYNLMTNIDHWVIRTYFRWLAQNPKHMKSVAMCHINLSGSSIADPHFKEIVLELFVEYLIPHEKICFEISESIAIVNLNASLDFINMFKKFGCKFCLDNFGTGFSSYGYLKNIPVDFVKIEGNFVKDILVDPIDNAMVNSINEVAQAIGMKTVAEYVESSDIYKQVLNMGIDYAQGYGLHRPAPLAQLGDDN